MKRPKLSGDAPGHPRQERGAFLYIPLLALGLTLVLGLGSGKEKGKDSTQGGTVAAP